MSIIFLTIIPMNYIYNKSVFGEYAYQYMCLPVSYSDLVKGKVLAAFIYCTISVFIFILCAAFFMISIFNSGGTAYGDFIEKSTIALINTHKMLSNNNNWKRNILFVKG